MKPLTLAQVAVLLFVSPFLLALDLSALILAPAAYGIAIAGVSIIVFAELIVLSGPRPEPHARTAAEAADEWRYGRPRWPY